MSEHTNTQSFQEMLDESLVTVKSGDVYKSTVVRVTPTEVIVDLGFKSDGIISRSDFSDDQTTELVQLTKPGDIIDVWVLRVNDGEGNVVCSKKKAESRANLKNLEAACETGEPLLGKVAEIVKGGMTVNIQGCRAFVPSSQASNRFIKDLSEFKGKEMNFQILEFDRSGRRLRIIAGRRELAGKEADDRRNEVFGKLKVGQRVEGTVSRIVEFGAFVDLGGVDGLIHVTELSWQRVKKVTDVLAVGDTVSALVKDFDPEKGKISLSLKDAADNPWNGILERYPIDSIVQGTVVRFAQFGAFVHLEDGIDGLVHISQIANKRVAKPADELNIGDVIDVLIVAIDLDNQKISLSKRAADEVLNPQEYDDDDYYDSGEVFDSSDFDTELIEEEIPVEEVPAVEETPVEETPVVEEPPAEESPAVEETSTETEE